MKYTFLSFLTWALASTTFGQTKCDVVNRYDDFIRMRIETEEGEKYRVKRVVNTGPKACFQVTDSHIGFIDYLITHFSSQENEKDLDDIKDSVTLQRTYIKRLQADTMFNRVMRELAFKSVEKKTSRDSVTVNRLLNVAVKYFAILKINDKGQYIGKMCTGLNNITSTEPIRHPFVEAFCFSTVFNNFQGETFNMYDEFVKGMEELYKVNMGTDPNERLLRAQGAMFMLMRNNPHLKKLLLAEYEKNKNWLPFVLKN